MTKDNEILTKNYKDSDILNRDDSRVDDDVIINRNDSDMSDEEVLNFPYMEWREGKK